MTIVSRAQMRRTVLIWLKKKGRFKSISMKSWVRTRLQKCNVPFFFLVLSPLLDALCRLSTVSVSCLLIFVFNNCHIIRRYHLFFLSDASFDPVQRHVSFSVGCQSTVVRCAFGWRRGIVDWSTMEDAGVGVSDTILRQNRNAHIRAHAVSVLASCLRFCDSIECPFFPQSFSHLLLAQHFTAPINRGLL